MKKLSFLLPIIIVACGSQVVEYPEETSQFPVNDGGNNELYDCHPAQVELCSNGVDDDGDELLDCEDPDCENDEACVSCVNQNDSGSLEEDAGASQQDSGNQTEKCTNGVDDDSDQLVDCEDPDCSELDVCQLTVDSGDVCSPNHEKTCENELHCCMKSCKLDHYKYMSCVRKCANKHNVCVKKRSGGRNHH
jgi:hypothetical protein